ncbi:hypothetical protein U472_00940 [Orenia metallireducens]|uniref:Lipoprotein n=1 Tax=Orenia metallireducens TaxID=1413210 RepID=A0A1C0ACY6_9FIRM|nr:hypothetical protein [Orenia metallireducens]OCL28483.1 hypothetical protein U472_00940 [Orenia metallireducens]
MNRKQIILLGYVLLLLLVMGCQSATINTYSDPSFNKNKITKVAVFPIRNTRLAPSESMQINRKIMQGINSKNPSIEIVSAQKALEILNQQKLADDWADFLEDYSISGFPNGEILFRIGDALGVDAIIQGEIVNMYQVDGRWGNNSGETRVTVRYTMLGVDSGKTLWEASSDGIKTTATTLGKAPALIEAINLAQDKIIQNLPF